MSYRYLEDVAIADVAFEASAKSLEDLFRESVDATLGVMVDLPDSVLPRVRKEFSAEEGAPDLLLFRLLEEIVYRKDAERLFLRVSGCRVRRLGGRWALEAKLAGEEIDSKRHSLGLDVKAVTLHLLSVEEEAGVWAARVVLDI